MISALIDKAQRVMFHSIDIALDNTVSDKDIFYHVLETNYDLKRQDIPTNYDAFHKALIEIYGVNHYKIDREILHVLHNLTKEGLYQLTDEIPVFITIVENHIEEYNRNIEKNEKQLDLSKAKLDKASRT